MNKINVIMGKKNIVKTVNYKKISFGFSCSNPRYKSQPQEWWIQHPFQPCWFLGSIELKNFLFHRIMNPSKWCCTGSEESLKAERSINCHLSSSAFSKCIKCQRHSPYTSTMQSLQHIAQKWGSLQEWKTVQTSIMYIWAHYMFDWLAAFLHKGLDRHN